MQLSLAGTVPSHETGLSMARLAVDEFKRMIDHTWLKAHRGDLVMAEIVPRGVLGKG
jgi:hypothetical protein